MQCRVLIQKNPETGEMFVAFSRDPLQSVDDLRLHSGEWAGVEPIVKPVILVADNDVCEALGNSEFRSALPGPAQLFEGDTAVLTLNRILTDHYEKETHP